ncbi:MAG: hypothetical protein KAH22_06715 [Thiotrichaceae bacterium]|nr:hypothetical protein [Thiotrichaceae bacterium]
MTYRVSLGLLCALLSLGCNLTGPNHFNPKKTQYNLMKSAVSNHNRQIGPYCCSGKTLTIKNQDNEPIGYIHLAKKSKAYPKLEVLVSGISSTLQPQPEIINSKLIIAADKAHKKEYTVNVGCVSYLFHHLKANFTTDKSQQVYFTGLPSHLMVDVKIKPCNKV